MCSLSEVIMSSSCPASFRAMYYLPSICVPATWSHKKRTPDSIKRSDNFITLHLSSSLRAWKNDVIVVANPEELFSNSAYVAGAWKQNICCKMLLILYNSLQRTVMRGRVLQATAHTSELQKLKSPINMMSQWMLQLPIITVSRYN